jgi:fatty-acid desaturase
MKDKILRWMAPSLWATSVLQLSLPFGLYLGATSGASWHWWAAMLFFYGIVYAMIGNNIGLHRYFTHGHFTVSKPVDLLFLWCGTMTGLGEPLSFALTHMVHHNPKYTDTPLDPHGPIHGKRSILFFYQKAIDVTVTPVFNRRVVELSRRFGWLHRYYIPFVLANAAILYAIDYKVFLFLWLIPASLAVWGVSFSVIRQHWPLATNNCRTHKWEPLYEGLHLNHHDYQTAPNCAVRPGEIDYTYQFSRLFRPKYNFRGQPKTK